LLRLGRSRNDHPQAGKKEGVLGEKIFARPAGFFRNGYLPARRH